MRHAEGAFSTRREIKIWSFGNLFSFLFFICPSLTSVSKQALALHSKQDTLSSRLLQNLQRCFLFASRCFCRVWQNSRWLFRFVHLIGQFRVLTFHILIHLPLSHIIFFCEDCDSFNSVTYNSDHGSHGILQYLLAK